MHKIILDSKMKNVILYMRYCMMVKSLKSLTAMSVPLCSLSHYKLLMGRWAGPKWGSVERGRLYILTRWRCDRVSGSRYRGRERQVASSSSRPAGPAGQRAGHGVGWGGGGGRGQCSLTKNIHALTVWNVMLNWICNETAENNEFSVSEYMYVMGN